MAVFKIENKISKKLNSKNFKNEKELQTLFENNLEEIFGIRFLQTEFSTTHGGRIDTLGIDDNNAPVIIEFKEGEKDNVINQGLFYLDWLVDHKGDFSELIRRKLGEDIEIRWEDVRLIIVAKSYNEYDKYAVNRISDNIELWRYVLYEQDTLLVEKVVLPRENKKSVESEKRRIIYKEYDLKHHLDGKSEDVKELVSHIREEIKKIDDQIKEKFNMDYIGYSLERNFAEIIVQSKGIWVHIDAPKEVLSDELDKLIDVSGKGHWATGNLKIRVENLDDLEYCMNIIKQSYDYFL